MKSSFPKSEQALVAKEQLVMQKAEKIDQLIEEQKKSWRTISGMTAAEAKSILMESMENEAKQDAAKKIKAD